MSRTLQCLVLLLLFAAAPAAVAGAQATSKHVHSQNASVPFFRNGKSIRFPNGLVIRLVAYAPVTGLTHPRTGQPLLPHAGDRFVTTTWLVKNTAHHALNIGTWVAKSRGLTSHGFVTGNAGEPAIIHPGTQYLYYEFFEVAQRGRVEIFYQRFQNHWSPQG